MNSIDNLKVSQTFFLPIFNYALLIERQYGDFIIPPPPGIYRVGDVEPVIVNTKRYYSQKITKNNHCVSTPITDFNSVTDTVIDEIGNVILPSFVMKNKEHYLRNEPTVPSKGLMIVELLVKKYIESISPWCKHSMYNNRLLNHFKPEASDIFNDGQIENLCESLFTQVSNFIENDIWHVYFVKFMGLDLVIEKTQDWRIIEYYRLTEERNNDYR